MKAVQTLPEGYALLRTVDLQKDKKTALCVNLLALVIAAVMAVGGALAVPIRTFFDMSGGIGQYILRFAALIGGSVAYIVLHELTHAVVMRAYGAGKVRFGFTGIYAFAGSEADYFPRRAYRHIALSPVILWGAVFALLCFLVPREWFWVVYLLQITNISGAAGDIWVTAAFTRLPADILISDSGVSMRVYGKIEETKP